MRHFGSNNNNNLSQLLGSGTFFDGSKSDAEHGEESRGPFSQGSGTAHCPTAAHVIRRLGVLLLLALLLGGILAAVGALWGWILGGVLPYQPAYSRAALSGAIEIGLLGLMFLMTQRNRIGVLAFLVALPVGALWGAYTFFMLGALQVAAGPVVFSSVLLGTSGFVGVLAPFAILRPSSA